MLKVINLFLVFMLVSIMASRNVYAAQNTFPRLGVNVEGIHKLKGSMPFTDIFKVSTGWFTSCKFDWQRNIPIDPGCSRQNSFNTREQSRLKLDQHGWVRSLPDVDAPEIYTSVVSGINLDEDFPLGRYVLLYAGKGDVEVSGSLNIIDKEPGRIEFDLIATQRGIKVKINKTHSRNYVRDIHLVAINNEKSFRQQPFDPNYIARLRPFDSIRFMPWINPRLTELVEWEQHPDPEYAHYTTSAGVPIEVMLDLAKRTDVAPWLNMPHKASDDFMHNYARLTKKKIRGDKKIYIEFSNEMWNVIFPATSYAIEEALKIWPNAYAENKSKTQTQKNSYERKVKLANNWYGKRSVEMCDIWKQVFGKQAHRVVCVIASQSNIDWVGQEALDCPLWKDGPCGTQVDAYATGPYFGDYIARLVHRKSVKKWASSKTGLDSLFKEIEQGGVLPKGPKGGAIQHFLDSNMKVSMKLADDYGLPLLAYESGQHLIRYDPPHKVTDPILLDFFKRANEDPRMRHAYQRYLKAWEENGGKTLMHFYGIGKSSANDSFGMLPSSRTEGSAKYNAMMAYLQTRYKNRYQHSKPLSIKQLEARRWQVRQRLK